MSRERFQRIEELYQAALELPASERVEFLESACAGDESLLAEVRGLIAHRTRVGPRFMRTPLVVVEPEPPPPEPPPTVAGYRVIDRIGEGGMGVVYRAEEIEPIRRVVALKVLKRGIGDAEVLTRFHAEQQALAIMEHRGVARIFDAGTTAEGRPYFAMEYVDGPSIDRYASEAKLGLRQRLELFMRVCDAVQHAHQKGVIHRDLKPSNILVATQDGEAVPKIIDFGIAKAIDRPLVEKAIFTQHGQLLGTPAYMSPEQARSVAAEIDTRTDVYSLGVVLYELITGSPPIVEAELRERAYVEIQRLICESDPEKPSTRLSGQLQRDDARLTRFARSLGTSARALVRQVRGDLDWIVMKAIERERDRRYASASELAADVRRHIDGEPVVAGAPDLGYRVRKFVRRHRVGVGASAAIAILLVASAIVTSILAVREADARRLADERGREARWASYLGTMSAAGAALALDDVATVRRVLALAPEEHRGWEWNHFAARADESDATVPIGGMARATAVSAAGRLVAVGLYGGRVRILAADTFQEVLAFDLAPDNTFVRAIAFDDARRRLVIAWRNEIHLRSLEDGASLGVLVNGLGPDARRTDFAAVAFDETSGRVVAGDHDGRVHLWRPESDVPAWTVAAHPGRSVAVAISGARAFSIGEGGAVVTLDAAGGAILGRIDVAPCSAGAIMNGDAGPVALTADARTNLVRRVRLTDGVEVAPLEGATAQIYALAADPAGPWIAAAGRDKSIRLWRSDDPAHPITLRGHERAVHTALFAPGGALVSTSRDGTMRRWSLDRARLRLENELHREPRTILSVSAGAGDAARVAMPAAGRLLLLDARDGATLHDLEAPVHDAACPAPAVVIVAMDAAGARVAAGRSDGRIDVRDVASGAVVASLDGHPPSAPCGTRAVLDLAFAPDGATLASAAGNLRLWDVAAAAMVREIALPAGAQARQVAFRPGGGFLAVAAGVPEALLFDPATGALRTALAGAGPRIETVAFSTDGVHVAAGDEDGAISLWSVDDGALVARARAHSDLVTAIVFAPDGTRIFSTSHDHTVRVWSPALDEIAILGVHETEVFDAAWIPGAGELVTVGGDASRGVARIWRGGDP